MDITECCFRLVLVPKVSSDRSLGFLGDKLGNYFLPLSNVLGTRNEKHAYLSKVTHIFYLFS